MTDYQFLRRKTTSGTPDRNKVSTILETPKTSEAKALRTEYGVVHLKQLYCCAKVLLGARHGSGGAIDFETQEPALSSA